MKPRALFLVFRFFFLVHGRTGPRRVLTIEGAPPVFFTICQVLNYVVAGAVSCFLSFGVFFPFDRWNPFHGRLVGPPCCIKNNSSDLVQAISSFSLWQIKVSPLFQGLRVFFFLSFLFYTVPPRGESCAFFCVPLEYGFRVLFSMCRGVSAAPPSAVSRTLRKFEKFLPFFFPPPFSPKVFFSIRFPERRFVFFSSALVRPLPSLFSSYA